MDETNESQDNKTQSEKNSQDNSNQSENKRPDNLAEKNVEKQETTGNWKVITPIVISTLALIVSILAYTTNREVLEIQRKTGEIIEKNNRPTLVFEYDEDFYLPGDDFFYKGERMPGTNKSLSIFNEKMGAPISHFKAEILEILEVTDKNGKLIDAGIHNGNSGYWKIFKTYEPNTGVGLLGRVEGKQMDQIAYTRVLNWLEEDFNKFLFNEIDVIKLDYYDSLGDEKTMYSFISDGIKVNSEYAEEMYKKYYRTKKILKLETVTKEMIEQWRQKTK